ncbi:MAG: hypothetical protein ACFCUI_01455 [Bernardetiaceae bacterium]
MSRSLQQAGGVWLSLLFFVIQCTPTPERALPLFNGLVFALQEGETVQEINRITQQDFLQYTGRTNVPLFRLVQGQGYRIFIGIPYQTTLQDLLAHPIDSATTLRAEASGFVRRLNRKGQTLIEEAIVQEDGNLVYLLLQTNTLPDTSSHQLLQQRWITKP